MTTKDKLRVLGLLMGLAAACRNQDDTMIVVEVTSDLAVPAMLDAVRIDVTGPSANSSKLYELNLYTSLPVRLALVPESAKDAALTVTAVGLFRQVEIVSQTVRVSFVPGESKLLTLHLSRQCMYVDCGPSQTCSAGVCTKVPTKTNLPDYHKGTGGMGGQTGVAGNGGRTGGDTAIGQGGTYVPGGGTYVPVGGTYVPIGGTAGAGGTSSTRTGGTCAVGQACGGDVIGTWEVTSSCLQHNGYADIAYLGLTCVPNLAKITGALSVTGRLMLDASGRYTDNTVTSGSETWELDGSCLVLSGTRVTCKSMGTMLASTLSSFGYQDFQCMDAANGGCTCQGKIKQAGRMGMLTNDEVSTGAFKVADGALRLGSDLAYSYCVRGAEMTASPRPESTYGTPYTGTIVLRNLVPGTGGTAGTGGTGGTRSSGGNGGSAGNPGSAGSAGSSGGTCVSGTPCGGDVVGSWDVTSSCLTLDGDFATRGTGLGCDTFKVTGALQVKGSFVAGSDRKFQDKTTTTGSVTVKMAKECLFMSGVWSRCDLIPVAVDALGFANTRCVDAADGGCTCSATVKQSGNMGLIVAVPETSGAYTVSNNSMVTGENPLTGAQLAYSYCGNSDKLTVTPKTASPPTSGTIVLQKTNANACTTLPAAPAFDIAPLPCEVVAKDGGGAACVAAHSTVRVIVPGYKGPLYQLCKGAVQAGPGMCKGTVQDVSSIDGFADVDAHNVFCANESCTITKIYDQSGKGNDLEPAPKGGAKATPDNPAKASALPVVIGNRKAYGLLLKAGMGYRAGCNGCTLPKGNGMALGDEPQTVYMVTSQKDLIDGCCFDYGNAETTCNVEGDGTAEAVYFGGGAFWGTGTGGKPGPWVMADLENGVYAGWENKQDKNISTNLPLKFDFVTAVLVGDTADKNSGKGRFALYGADAQGRDASLGKLTCMYDGIRPEKKNYVPMRKQGSIILGISGDNSSSAGGRFYEGATIAGPLVSKTTLSFLQAVIAAAKYQNVE